jgi:polar amino acid transport system substrate-binding protein
MGSNYFKRIVMIKAYFLLISFSSLFLLGTLVQNVYAEKKIVQLVELAGDKSYPPYSYSEQGVAKGIYPEILMLAFSKIPDYQLKIKMMAWKRAIVYVKKGKAVGFFPPYYSKERTTWLNFSVPILAETLVVFAKQETLNSHKNFPKGFTGLTACMNRGFTLVTGGLEFKKAVENKTIQLIEGNDNKACLNRVSRGIADFYINDRLIDTSKFPMIKRGEKASESFGHIGFTLKTKNYPFIDDLTNKFNQVIKQMKENGEIEKILKKY